MTDIIPTFNRAVDTALAEARGISEQRGGEYQDTWAIDRVFTPFADLVERTPRTDERAWRRLRAMASMIDVKISRLLGPWKHDTGIDLINYVAAFTTLMDEYTAAAQPGPSTPVVAGTSSA